MPRPGQLTEAQQDLAARYLPLARALARPFRAQIPDAADDFDSAALFGLTLAAADFDPGRGVRFGTYCRPRILGTLREARRRRLARRERSLAPADVADHFGHHDRSPDPLDEFAGPDRPPGEALERAEEVAAQLARLPARHAEALRLMYLGGLTTREAGGRMGLSHSRVSLLHLEALAMLRGTWGPGTRLAPSTRRRPPRKVAR